MGVRVAPITTRDIRAVSEFLHTHLNDRVPAADWARAAEVPWKVDAPNHGFMLLAGDDVVGAYLAFYSRREVAGRGVAVCNLGAWCVRPEHRFHSLKLLKALLAQPGYHFTDLSPSGSVVPINTRLGFRFLDTETALIPNLPWPAFPGRLTARPERIRAALTGSELALYLDHADLAAARFALLSEGERSCLVIYRRDRRKGLPLFASILHVSDRELFARLRRRFLSHLLLRHGVPFTLAETRVAGPRPRLSRPLGAPRRKMFRGDELGPGDIDYLYSELVCLRW